MVNQAVRLVQGKDVIQSPLANTISFVAGQHQTLDLPRTGIITHLELEVNLNYDDGTTDREDGFMQLMKSVTVRDGRNNTYFHVSDGRLLGYLNSFQRRGVDQVDALGAGTGVTARANFGLHFGANPFNFQDPSGGIPADELSSLVLDIEWGTTADLWSTLGPGAINSVVVTVTPTIIVGDTPSHEVVRRTLLIPQYRSAIYTISGALAALTFEQDLPNMMLDKTLFMVVDGSPGARSDTIASEVAYKDVKSNRSLWEVDFIPWARRNVAEYLPGQLQTARAAGVGYINWPTVVGDVALDLRDRLTGHDKIAFTTTAGGSGERVLVVHKGWSGLAPAG